MPAYAGMTGRKLFMQQRHMQEKKYEEAIKCYTQARELPSIQKEIDLALKELGHRLVTLRKLKMALTCFKTISDKQGIAKICKLSGQYHRRLAEKNTGDRKKPPKHRTWIF